MAYTLLVIDMQPGFDTANRERVRKNCRREIDQAIKDDAHIIFLEYDGYQATLPELTSQLHEKCAFHTKRSDDGSSEVEQEVILNKRPKTFKVCGINTDCCVLATVRGLTARFPMANINVVADACDSDWYHQNGLKQIAELAGNVSIKYSKES